MFDPVPWFVGGGAVHSPEVARTLAFAATGGREGVGRPGDLKVNALPVPGAAVQIEDGTCTILNRESGGDQQSYMARNQLTTQVPIPATGSSGGRSYLIVARVEDPNMAGGSRWTDWDTAATGPYVFPRPIPVPAGTTSLQAVSGYANDSAVALARVDLPASTGTVTPGMIVDLRRLVTPRTERQNPKGPLTDATVTLDQNVWRPFPANPITGLIVPPWATHAVVMVSTTLRYVSGDAYANYQGFMGPAGQQDGTTLFTDSVIDATTGGGSYRQPLLMPSDGDWPVPAAIRGKAVQLSFRARGRTNGGKIATGASDYYVADVTFKEKAA